MYSVYILKSLVKDTKTYVGFTSKPIRFRLQEHNKGLSAYTSMFKPWELIYFETFTCESCALKREKYLKSGIGFRFTKIMMYNYKKLK